MTPYYQDDYVTLYHGDSLEVLPTFKIGSVDAIITDPPYVIGAVSAGSLASKAGTWADMMNSSLWFSHWYSEVARIRRDAGCFWTFLNWRTLPVVMRAAIDARMPITSVAVWDKEWIGPGGLQGLRPSYEMIALLAGESFIIQNRSQADVLRHKVGSYKASGHPAEKPEALVRKLITMSSLPEDALIVDPFVGSGTTLRAAKNLGFRSIGIEADEKFCEIAAMRCSQDVLEINL